MEPTQSNTKDVAKMKEEVVKELKKNKRPNMMSCGLMAFGLLLLFILWLTWTVAATGLVRVPGLSAISYSQPEPTREVNPGEGLESVIQTAVTTELRRAAAEGNETQCN